MCECGWEKDAVDEELTRIITVSASELTKTQDHYLFDFFGSIEYFMEVGHLYVIEERPVEIERVEIEGFGDDNTTIRFTQEFRLRLKTDEELAAEALNPGKRPSKEEVTNAWERVNAERKSS